MDILADASKEGGPFQKTVRPAEQLRPKLKRRREQWIRYQTRIDPERLVFIDETWIKTNMAPLRGWGRREGLCVVSPRTVTGAR